MGRGEGAGGVGGHGCLCCWPGPGNERWREANAGTALVVMFRSGHDEIEKNEYQARNSCLVTFCAGGLGCPAAALQTSHSTHSGATHQQARLRQACCIIWNLYGRTNPTWYRT